MITGRLRCQFECCVIHNPTGIWIIYMKVFFCLHVIVVSCHSHSDLIVIKVFVAIIRALDKREYLVIIRDNFR